MKMALTTEQFCVAPGPDPRTVLVGAWKGDHLCTVYILRPGVIVAAYPGGTWCDRCRPVRW